ncbi:MAG: phosphoribosyltransferase family protein [Candidatus Odinarchaeia archaeon]
MCEEKKARTYYDKMTVRLSAVEVLRELKLRHSYKELAEKTGVHPSILNRYIKGYLIPSYDKAVKILSEFATKDSSKLEKEIISEIKEKLIFNNAGFFNNTLLISDTQLLRKVGRLTQIKYRDANITKVMTAAVDGVPVAAHVANSLSVPLVVGKYNKEVGVDEFYEAESSVGASGILMTMFVPRMLLKKNDRVLIVDDVIRTGETQRLLIEIVKKAKAKVIGIIILLGIGSRWRRNIKLERDAFIKIFQHVKV